MKKITTQGICCIEPLSERGDWYWGMDYTGGDMYEAMELYQQDSVIKHNRLLLVHYPDGKTVQPVHLTDGQFLGLPLYCRGQIFLLLADFPAGKIQILRYDHLTGQTTSVAVLPLSAAADCYNLCLSGPPLMLIRQGSDQKFEMIWPDRLAFYMEHRESFAGRSGDHLYFSVWHEDPEYWEEVLVRSVDTGEILDRMAGSVRKMPDGQFWILTPEEGGV